MFERLPILVLVPHADAGDRTKWTSDQDVRPLTELGREQATALATIIGTVDAVVTSPARRCVETVEPIATASGVEIDFDDGLRESTFATEVEDWDRWSLGEPWRSQLVAGAALGRFIGALDRLAPGQEGRVAVGAHGDLVPLFALLAAAYFGVPTPPPLARGGAYEIDGRSTGTPIKALGALAPSPKT